MSFGLIYRLFKHCYCIGYKAKKKKKIPIIKKKVISRSIPFFKIMRFEWSPWSFTSKISSLEKKNCGRQAVESRHTDTHRQTDKVNIEGPFLDFCFVSRFSIRQIIYLNTFDFMRLINLFPGEKKKTTVQLRQVRFDIHNLYDKGLCL